jgi:hypothetical protein
MVTGKWKGAPSFLIRSALEALEAIRKAARLLAFFENDHSFTDGEDHLAFDLSLQGCFKANLKFETRTCPLDRRRSSQTHP